MAENVIRLSGRIDTSNAAEWEKTITEQLSGETENSFDADELEYISSAGLRVLLSAQKTMNKQGTMVITGVSTEVQEIFDVTGFSDILTIE
jgi:anti-sigma B factor antagonist